MASSSSLFWIALVCVTLKCFSFRVSRRVVGLQGIYVQIYSRFSAASCLAATVPTPVAD